VRDDEAAMRRKRERAVEHPLRREILELLAGGRRLPTTTITHELSEDPSLSQVRYHVLILADAELVVATGGSREPPVYALAA
jgi:DNA-binding transcriptional ArsR family regulator